MLTKTTNLINSCEVFNFGRNFIGYSPIITPMDRPIRLHYDSLTIGVVCGSGK